MTSTDRALVRLLTWLSPGFPVGGYSYSHGLETAVDRGLVKDRLSGSQWIGAILRLGSGRADAVFLRAAWRAMAGGDLAAVSAVAADAAAFRATAETALESTSQGRAFLSAVLAAWPEPRTEAAARHLDGEDLPISYPVAVGLAAQGGGLSEDAATLAYLHAFTAGLVSAAVRLIPLGQTDGLKVLAELEPAILAVAGETATLSRDAVGTATWLVDWTSARHETQDVRLFRS